ncbi:MAG: YraN family protein [Syntrophomonas sp.]
MKKELGARGEEIAALYLQKKGYKILDRNYFTRYGEVDIICIKKRIISFVEVKTRRGTSFGFPEEAITQRKKEHIRKAALMYLESSHQAYGEISFDVISIMIVNGEEKINHIENAF